MFLGFPWRHCYDLIHPFYRNTVIYDGADGDVLKNEQQNIFIKYKSLFIQSEIAKK